MLRVLLLIGQHDYEVIDKHFVETETKTVRRHVAIAMTLNHISVSSYGVIWKPIKYRSARCIDIGNQ